MFCMYCGQQLPDGARFCLQCGTPQGAVSPTGTTQAETINLDGAHTFVPAMCPNCNAHMKVDSSLKIAHCDSCGTECLVQDAIKALSVNGNVSVGKASISVEGADTVNINAGGTNIDALLKRIEIMLADGDFNGAMSKCDTILDSDPTNGKVYLYMLMSYLYCRNRADLAAQKTPFDSYQYYRNAMQYGDSELKNELQGYINTINERHDAELKNLKVGDKIYFGTNNGKCYWWKALKIQDRKALIILSDYLTNKPYHQPGGPITWSECTLRKWLNNDFINENFTQAERARILLCELNNDNNPESKTPGGSPTTDKVFLLSINEVNALFANDKERANRTWWWLRSPGGEPSRAAGVRADGSIHTGGSDVGTDGYRIGLNFFGHCVRPAMWISLES